MSVRVERLDPTGVDHDALVEFMTRNEFPFHVRTRPTVEQIEAAITAGNYRDHNHDSFWIDHDQLGRIGFLRLEDLTDNAPLFDLRLDSPFRGRGLGVTVLRAVTDQVFSTMPEVNRFEGHTREDNIAMRRTFQRCGWLKEAHYREGWPVPGSTPVATVAYGILRMDWATGRTTTFTWDDLPE